MTTTNTQPTQTTQTTQSDSTNPLVLGLNHLATLAEASGRTTHVLILKAAAEQIEGFDNLYLKGLSQTSKGLILHALDEFIKNGAHIPEECEHFPKGVERPTAEESLFLYKVLGKLELVTSGDIDVASNQAINEVYPGSAPIREAPAKSVPVDSKQDAADRVIGDILDRLTGKLTPEVLEKKVEEYREFLVKAATTKPDMNGTPEERVAAVVSRLAPMRWLWR